MTGARSVLLPIAALTILAWAYLFGVSAGIDAPGAMVMPSVGAWSAATFATVAVMWAVMMVGMMLPSAAPMLIVHRRVAERRRIRGSHAQPTWLFAGGYVLVWTAFALVAATANGLLHSRGLLDAMMGSATAPVGGAILVAAGAYQVTPIKDRCLSACQTPVGYLGTHWRDGRVGTVRMGVEHGLYCVGCCWLIMALLFVMGVMNLAWVAVLAVFILLEKVLPRTTWLTRVSGLALIGWGVVLLT